MPKRKNTKLEAEGAEFLVLGNLLTLGISSYKAYINFPGYDLTALNPDTKQVARIQVKSRWATNYDRSFPIKNFDCDFVVHVALNRGYSFGKKTTPDDSGIKPPLFYVFPVDLVQKVVGKNGKMPKVQLSSVPNVEEYQDNWRIIRDYLSRN